MKQTIGVIGSRGDLGTQLTTKLRSHGYDVLECSRSLDNGITINEVLRQCDIIHVCAPTSILKDAIYNDSSIVILHDSVMNSSREASNMFLRGTAGIIHMLMNNKNMVVIATDAPHDAEIERHITSLGLNTHHMTIDAHDYLMARSQAPLALLCKTLLPYLYEQADHGMLTPSGQLLADTLRSRELTWTDETIHSILRNPQLQTLLDDMRAITLNDKGSRS